ncbi:MAG: hypothetical protein JWL64_2060, partial [Frankiales bacterium]|nr:hypothetical protein [Frankiales bacterium]
VAAIPALDTELAVRRGRVPLLRLPYPVEARPAAGAATEVRVTVRPESDALVRRLLAGLDPALLLVLPGLVELRVVVDGQTRVLRADQAGDDVLLDGRRWRVRGGAGEVDPRLLADRPVEEQGQTRWQATWALPLDGAPGPGAVWAPTATDDPLSLPVLLSASLPLGPDRRRVVPGPLTTAILDGAAEVLVELIAELPAGPEWLRLVPGPLGAGEVDALVGSAVLSALRSAPLLDGRRPDRSVVLDGASEALVGLLTDVVDLLPAAWSASRWEPALRALGVQRIDLARLTELLAGVDRPASWWHALYDALPPDRDQLGALPVPLVGGRVAPSPRGLLLADLGADLAPLGLRVVDPEAAHPVLLRLGAHPAEPRTLLEDPRVRSAVRAAADNWDLDRDDPAAVTEAVLALVADVRPGELPWLADLLLPDSRGGWRPAGELLLPGGRLAAVVDPEAGFGLAYLGRHRPETLLAVGVLADFAVVPVDAAEGVDGLDDWLATLAPGEEPDLVVRDLDLVRPEAWPVALRMLQEGDLLRLPYVRWWLAAHPVVGGARPADLRAPGSDPRLVGLYDEAVVVLPGVRTSLDEVLADDPQGLLDRLADPARKVGRDQLRAICAALVLASPAIEPPDAIRAVLDGEVVVVAPEDAVLVDRPDLLPRTPPYAVVPVPLELAVGLAELFDLALASELLPDANLDPAAAAAQLLVRDAAGHLVEVSWAVVGEHDVWCDVDGQARAEAWRTGRWQDRHVIAARLRGAPAGEDDLDPV